MYCLDAMLIRAKKKCSLFISDNQGKVINTNFWLLNSKERKSFILTTCTRLNVWRRTVDSDRKQNTFKYTLQNEKGEVTSVCKTFFNDFGIQKNE